METVHKPCDVFISRKSADSALAKEIYHFLNGKGLEVFESDETLPKLGSSDYRRAIDKALDECKHTIVVGSSVENIASSWVEAEWGFYIGEKRAGRKKGNILTVITDNLRIDELPPSLRYYEVIFYYKGNFEKIAAYVGKDYADPKYKPAPKSIFRRKWFVPALVFLFAVPALIYYVTERNKPFDASIVLKPQQSLPNYPPFNGGELQLQIDNRFEKKNVQANEEVVIKQLPASLSDAKVAVTLTSKNWKLVADTIELKKVITLHLMPNGNLEHVFGRVIDSENNGLPGYQVFVDDTTCCTTSSNGNFDIRLPVHRQRNHYTLTVKKDGREYSEDYWGGTGTRDVGPVR